VSPITNLDFRSELRQSARSQQALIDALDFSGLDPRKIHHDSARLRNALGEARESIASNLGITPAEIEFVGELGLGFWLGIEGMLRASEVPFIYSAIDRQLIHAIARKEEARKVVELPVSQEGLVDYEDVMIPNDSIITWQAANRETGVRQVSPKRSSLKLFADLTSTINPKALPPQWVAAIWDPRTFSGPEGLAILAIRDEIDFWRSPLPNFDNRRNFGSHSKSAVIATAVALQEWIDNLSALENKLTQLNSKLRQLLISRIPGVRIASAQIGDPQRIALIVDGIVAEQLLREMEKSQILIDAGSACSAAALSPSHVLSAMGFGEDGQLRITLKADHDEVAIEKLVEALATEIARLRSN
jgi:cysteine desulfurase